MGSIYGSWYNELGSFMVIGGSGAQISGSYFSAVGHAAYEYQLSGRVNTGKPLPGSGIALGWAVAWVNAYQSSPSGTSWAGQYQIMPDGTEQITTLWLLVTETTPGDDWASTNVGQDIFTRNAPSQHAVARRKRTGHYSHPPRCAEQ
jgi:hypothetical protein